MHSFKARILDVTNDYFSCPECQEIRRVAWEEKRASFAGKTIADVPELLTAWDDDLSPEGVRVDENHWGSGYRFRCPADHRNTRQPLSYLCGGCSACKAIKTRKANADAAAADPSASRLTPEISSQWHPPRMAICALRTSLPSPVAWSGGVTLSADMSSKPLPENAINMSGGAARCAIQSLIRWHTTIQRLPRNGRQTIRSRRGRSVRTPRNWLSHPFGYAKTIRLMCGEPCPQRESMGRNAPSASKQENHGSRPSTIQQLLRTGETRNLVPAFIPQSSRLTPAGLLIFAWIFHPGNDSPSNMAARNGIATKRTLIASRP